MNDVIKCVAEFEEAVMQLLGDLVEVVVSVAKVIVVSVEKTIKWVDERKEKRKKEEKKPKKRDHFW